ncbi:MAG: hypothetical protein H3C34_24815, partial [Caldilineaceae bacterium]|nr:hypothetical protein [Caldilineaceae bacterium]
DYMDNDKMIGAQFEALGLLMRQHGQPTENSGWARLVPFTPPQDDDTKMDGKTTYYTHQPIPEVVVAAGPVTTAMMIATKNDLRLKDKKWQQQTGSSLVPTQDAAPPAEMARAEIAAAADEAPPSSDSLPLLTLAQVASLAPSSGDAWNVSLSNTNAVHGLETVFTILDSSKEQIRLTLKNTYIRYLVAYIRFYDVNGNAMTVPNWQTGETPMASSSTMNSDIEYEDLRYLGVVGPVNNVFAIPIFSDPGELEVIIRFPPNAVSAEIYGAGIGTGSNEWPKAPMLGGILTGLVNLALPAFMLTFSVASQANKELYKIVDDLTSKPAFLRFVIAAGITYFGGQFVQGAVHHKMDWHAFSTLSQLLFNVAAKRLLLWVEATVTAETVAEEIPFAGWILIVINISTGVAQMAETIVEISTSPWMIENKLSTSITTQVALHPDPRHGAFPQAPAGVEATYLVKMMYKGQTRPTVAQHVLVPADSTETQLPAVFPGNTLGGQVKFEADYYLGDWLAGKATTGWLDNDESHARQVTLYLVQYPIPLTDKSIYVHSALLTYQNGAYKWQPNLPAPIATVASSNTSSSGNAISAWDGITLSQRHGMLGYAWKAAGMDIVSCATGQGGQLYALQNVDIPGTPMDTVKFPTCGFDGPTQLIYDPFPPKFLMDADGQWELDENGRPKLDPSYTQLGEYYIDPRKAEVDLTTGGGYHLRKVSLDDNSAFDMNSDQLSWGRFAYFPDSFAMHPSGHVVGVSSKYGKIQIIQLPTGDGVNDDEIPVARAYAGKAINRDRHGLLVHPIAVTCSYDGTILILEESKAAADPSSSLIVSRIQAFDLYGNPVNRFFDGDGQPSPFLDLSEAADYNYLDIAAVGDAKVTYIFVLYYVGDGAAPSDYHMTVYQYGIAKPDKNPLVTTDNVAAARLTVDMWHTVYTLNYEMVTDGSGNPAGPATGDANAPAGRTTPSLSEWLPPVPQT